MQTLNAQSSHNVVAQYPIAAAGERVLACILDIIIKAVYVLFAAGILISLEVEIVWPYVVFVALPWMFYHLLFEIFMNGQSPGKRAFQLQVVRLDGTSPGTVEFLLRWVFSSIDFYILTGIVALLIVVIGGKGQRLGDIIAETRVVRRQAVSTFTPQKVIYIPTFPQVVHLDPTDITLIQRAIDANREYENLQPTLMVSDKFKELLTIQTSLSPSEFLNTLVKDYNHLRAQ